MEELRTGTANALAPCGPECRFAQNLPRGDGDWIWCARIGSPRSIASATTDCPWFSPRRHPAGPADSSFNAGEIPLPAE